MENKVNLIEPLIERAEEFGKTSLELYKLKIIEKAVTFTSVFVSKGVVILVLCMFTILMNIATALWLGELLGKVYYGFYCVAGFYGILGLVFHFLLNNWMKKTTANRLVSNLLD